MGKGLVMVVIICVPLNFRRQVRIECKLQGDIYERDDGDITKCFRWRFVGGRGTSCDGEFESGHDLCHSDCIAQREREMQRKGKSNFALLNLKRQKNDDE